MFEQREGKPHILVVDDEPEIRTLLCELLIDEYDCATASSAEEALSGLAGAEFDLVLSDIQMGGMSGLEMIPRVLERPPDTGVAMASGRETIEGAAEAMPVGASGY